MLLTAAAQSAPNGLPFQIKAAAEIIHPQSPIAAMRAGSPLVKAALAGIQPDTVHAVSPQDHAKQRYQALAALAKVTSTAATRQTRNFGGTFAASSYMDWIHRFHAQVAARKVELSGITAHIIPSVEDALALFDKECGPTLAEAIENHPFTHEVREKGKNHTAYAVTFYEQELQFARDLLRSLLGALKIISKSKYIGPDQKLQVYSSTTQLLGLGYLCDLDETLVCGTAIRPSVPIVFDFLKYLLGEDNIGFGLLSSRGLNYMRAQLTDPLAKGTLFELAPMMDRDRIFSTGPLHTKDFGYLLSGGTNPYKLESLLGWDEARVDLFWEQDFDAYWTALAELSVLTEKTTAFNLTDPIYSTFRRSRLKGNDLQTAILADPQMVALREQAQSATASEEEISTAARKLAADYLNCDEDRPLTDAEKVLYGLIHCTNAAFNILDIANRYGNEIYKTIALEATEACAALTAWKEKHQDMVNFIYDLKKAYVAKEQELAQKADNLARTLKSSYYYDEHGTKINLGLTLSDILRFLLALNLAPENELTFILNNMRPRLANAFYHLLVARDVYDSAGDLPIDPNELLNIPPNKRDKVFMIGNANYEKPSAY